MVVARLQGCCGKPSPGTLWWRSAASMGSASSDLPVEEEVRRSGVERVAGAAAVGRGEREAEAWSCSIPAAHRRGVPPTIRRGQRGGLIYSRLSESPKFFGLLVVVSTGHGYVLSSPLLYKQKEVFFLASLLSYAAVLWASWYLAALGYAFRFLQNSQHRIENALGWNPKYVPGSEEDRMTGQPPQWPPRTFRRSIDAFWLLPGIYHAHAASLAVFLILFAWLSAITLRNTGRTASP
jgi:hypothetical protein